jgi:hypothetical protein
MDAGMPGLFSVIFPFISKKPNSTGFILSLWFYLIFFNILHREEAEFSLHFSQNHCLNVAQNLAPAPAACYFLGDFTSQNHPKRAWLSLKWVV